jgi:anti-sigma factor RsiW
MITCRDVYGFLDDYLSGEIDLQTRVAFLAHLALCPACRRYLKTYETSIAAARQAEGAGSPLETEPPEALVQAILASRTASFVRQAPE